MIPSYEKGYRHYRMSNFFNQIDGQKSEMLQTPTLNNQLEKKKADTAQPHTQLAGPKTGFSTTQIKRKRAQGFKVKPQRPNIDVSAAKAKLPRAKFTSKKEYQSSQTTKSFTESSDED